MVQYSYSTTTVGGVTGDHILSGASTFFNTAAGGASPVWSAIDNATYYNQDPNYDFLLTGITDERGIRYATWAYDTTARAVSSVHAGNVDLTTIAYNDSSLERTVTNPLGKVTDYTFVELNQKMELTTVASLASTNTPASTKTVSYDGNGNISKQTDEEGRVTTFVRDSYGRPTEITRGFGTAGQVTRNITWASGLALPTQIVDPGLTTTFSWTSSGQLSSLVQTDTTTQSIPYSTNGESRTWTYSYNSTGELSSIKDPSGQSRSYSYSAGHLSSYTNELGQVTTVNSANGRGEPTSITDPNGIITALAYDNRGRLTSVSVDTAHTPATTSIAYDLSGDVTSITDPIGAVQTFTYDSARRLTEISNSAGESVNYVRDAMGNATSITVKNSSGSSVYSKSQVFDELGRLIKSVGSVPANSTYQFGYDKTDNLVSITDPRSYTFAYGFDALNRLISETDEANAVVHLTRDGTDQITGYEDARSLQTTYVRDGFGDIIQESSPDKGTTTYSYDARGLLTQRTDPRGVVTNYQYDNAGRLDYKYYNNDSTDWDSVSWDDTGSGNYGIGYPVGTYSQSALDWRVYDSKGDIITDWRTNNPAPAVPVYYTYDLAGNVTSMSYPSGRIVTYSRDSLGRISGVTTQQSSGASAQAVVASVTWNPFGPISSFVMGAGLNVDFTYDTNYRISRIQAAYAGATWLDRSYSWTGETLDSSPDNQFPGNSTPFTYSQQSQTFTYTPTHRLASALGYYGTLGWTYDSNGNRLTETANGTTSTYSYPATSNRLSSVTPGTGTPRAFTYDAAGNVLTDSRSGGLGMTFTNDVEGRLASAYQTNSSANGGAYTYDFEGKLSSRTVTQSVAPTSTTTLYVYDLHHHIIAETDTSGNTLREYIWLNDLPIAVVDDVNTTPVIYYVLTDHLGRPARLIDYGGTWVWDVIYSPFGAESYVYTNPAVMNLQFPGQYFQMEVALDNNWHRQYDPTLGRYLQPDPLINDDGDERIGGVPTNLAGLGASISDGLMLGNPKSASIAPGAFPSALPQMRAMFADGPSIYAYVGDSPLNHVDPSGLWTINIGLSGSISASINIPLIGPVGFSGGGFGGIVWDGSHLAAYYGGGLGTGIGAGGSLGIQIGGSNAATVCDLRGPFLSESVSGGEGLILGGEAYAGSGSHGQNVTGGNFFIGGGGGTSVSGTGGATYTVVKPW